MSDIGFRWVYWPYARLRRELAVQNGVPIQFVFQLEYNVEATEDGLPPNDWQTVARFDHDISGPHNVAQEGLHLDLYKHGKKYEQRYGFPDVPLTKAPDFCEQFLIKRADQLIDQFEAWHDVGKKWDR